MLGQNAGPRPVGRRPSEQPFRWSAYPAGFDALALDAAVEAAAPTRGALVVDPFVGTGGAAVRAVGRGERFWGTDAHPLFAELARVKLLRPGPPSELREVTREVVARAVTHRGQAEVEHPLVQRALPPQMVSELAALRDEADRLGGAWSTHLRWAIVGALRDSVGFGWPYSRPARVRRDLRPPADLVLARTERMADDLATAPQHHSGEIVWADAREAQPWRALGSGAVDACVTSPPYLNQVHYAEVTRLEVFFLRLAKTWGEMVRYTGHALVASSTQQVDRSRAQRAEATLADYPAVAVALRTLIERLQREQAGRRRPKAYDALVSAYFADMSAVLENLRRALAPGGRAAFIVGDSAPYGIWVDTPSLIALLASEIGFEVLDDRWLRTRGSRWPGAGRRHARVLSERLVVFRRRAWGRQETLPGLTG